MSDQDESGVDLTIKERSASKDVAHEWVNEFEDDGAATAIDSEALQNLRTIGAEGQDAEPIAAGSETLVARSAKVQLQEVGDAGLTEGNSDFDDQAVTRMDARNLGDVSASEDAPGKEPCPDCGVMVAPGYPRCPRCKCSLVATKSARQHTSGGTSVVGRTVPWAIVFIAAIVTATIIYLAERDPVVEGPRGRQTADEASANADE